MTDSALTYEAVAPLLMQVEVHGGLLNCTFHCPRSGRPVQARAALCRERTPRPHPVYDVVAASVASLDATVVCTEAQRRAAVLAAFRNAFLWAGDPPSWMSREAARAHLPGFARQLLLAPVERGYDRFILARMLSEVMRADGRVRLEELGFMGAHRTVGRSLAELAEQPDLKPAELAQVGPGAVRETMLMLAWALAMVDLNLDPTELTALKRHCDGLGLSATRAGELKAYAQQHLAR